MQVSSSLGIFLTTDLESWSPSRFRLGGDAEKLCSDTLRYTILSSYTIAPLGPAACAKTYAERTYSKEKNIREGTNAGACAAVERWTVQMPGGWLASTSAYTNCWENPPFRNSAPATSFSACTGSASLLSSAQNAEPAVLLFSEEPRSPVPYLPGS